MDSGTRIVLQGLARAVAVGITFVPMLGKFVAYSQQVAEFQMWGIPFAEHLVPVTGVVQLSTLLMIAIGFAGRYGAAALSVVMLVAMASAGPTHLNIPVFVSCVTIMVLGTGPYTRWDPPLLLVDGVVSDRSTPS